MHQSAGEQAETQITQHLQQQGLRIIQRNYRCRGGEIDIIALHNETLVFIEVRLRNNPRYGDGLASVDRRKQQRLAHAAAHFLQSSKRWGNYPCRFDVIAVQTRQSESMTPTWVKAAFTL